MNMASAEFLIFVAAIAFLYYAVPGRFQWLLLLLGSIAFLVNGNGIQLAAVMGLAVLGTWFAGLALDKKKSKGILIAALIFDAGMLIVLKEVNFFLEPVRIFGNAIGHPLAIQSLKLAAPIGISYYTLNLISYLLDLYWGVGAVQKNLAKFALFAGYFPSLTSGPIIRYREIAEELYMGHRLSYQNICFGAQRILWGFFKKLVVSERLAVVVNTVYEDYHTYAGAYVFIAVICFVFQLYTDFSGCIDIVLGVSELFGIKLPENFRTPFFSKSISEFWCRWHITLGEWLKDYILYPILKTQLLQKIGDKYKKRFGKKLGKKIPVWIGLFPSWFLIGFWHGGAWNYIFGSGLFMWFLIVLGEACKPLFEKIIKIFRINTDCFSFKLFQSLRTFFCFMVGLSFFRSYNGFAEGVGLWKSAFSTFNPWILVDGSLLNLGLSGKEWVLLLLSLLLLGVSGIMREVLGHSLREWLAEQNIIFRWAVLYVLLFAVIIFGCYGIGYDAQAFIYQQF